MERFYGGTAVVTGGGDGIGRALCLALAGAGMRVAVLDIRAAAAEECAAAVASKGAIAVAVECDVADADSVEAAALRVQAHFGEVHLLWANAGVGVAGGVTEVKEKNLEWVVGVNVRGTLNTLRAFVPAMRLASGDRHVAVTASAAALVQPGAAGIGLYAASKHAVVGIGEGLAAELAESGIGVTILCPGLVNTRIWDGARARPERYGGQTFRHEEDGERWRQLGMDASWVADEALRAVAANDLYVCPVEARTAEQFEERVARIRASLRLWKVS